MDLKRSLALAAIVALIIGFFAQPAWAQGGSTHVVQSGDTLYAIATRYGVDVNELASFNGVASEGAIYPGQSLLIPVPAVGYDTLTPAPQPEPSFSNTTWNYAPAPQATVASTAYAVQPTSLVKPLPTGAQTYSAYTNVYPTPSSTSAWPTTLEPAYQPQPVYTQPLYQPQAVVPSYTSPQSYLPLPANSLTLPTLPSLSTKPATAERWIDVNLRTQMLVAFEGQTPVFQARVSTGIYEHPTVAGTYSIYVKYESADMRGGTGQDAYYLQDVPYVMYFHGSYGLHGTYWHNNFGQPMSHGCVNLSIPDAQWLFSWASVGTKVVTHY